MQKQMRDGMHTCILSLNVCSVLQLGTNDRGVVAEFGGREGSCTLITFFGLFRFDCPYYFPRVISLVGSLPVLSTTLKRSFGELGCSAIDRNTLYLV